MISHKPVLLQTACDFLQIKKGGLYVDCTFGAGGHTSKILQNGGNVIAFDVDDEAVAACLALKDTLSGEPTLEIIKSNYADITNQLNKRGVSSVSGILLDAGVSSHHFDTPKRGFSFQKEGPLDMRMDQSLTVTSADIVNLWPSEQLTKIFRDYGDIIHAKHLADRIVANRPFTTTTELARITAAYSRQAFQALRITVNDELESLDSLLKQSIDLLSPKSRIVVISFHSLEDKLVKTHFHTWARSGQGIEITPSVVTPSESEILENSRAKSAKLRVFEKI